MELKISIPKYDPDEGFNYRWQFGYTLKVQYEEGTVVITANKEGLHSLANHLLNLAQETVPEGYHLHFDIDNSLEEGSTELIIQKKANT